MEGCTCEACQRVKGLCIEGCGRRVSREDTDGRCMYCRYPVRTFQRPKGQRTPDPRPGMVSLYGMFRRARGAADERGRGRAEAKRAKQSTLAKAQWSDPEKRARLVAGLRRAAAERKLSEV